MLYSCVSSPNWFIELYMRGLYTLSFCVVSLSSGRYYNTYPLIVCSNFNQTSANRSEIKFYSRKHRIFKGFDGLITKYLQKRGFEVFKL